MEILGIIPARGGSKGVPGKNIKPLLGKPLIAYTFDAVAASKYLTRTILTTDTEAIADLGRAYDVEVPFLRPAELASDNSPATGYISHCLEFMQREQDYRPEIVVLLQPTSPCRSADDIDASVKLLLDNPVDAVVSVAELPAKYHPNWQFEVTADGRLLPCAADDWAALTATRQALAPTYSRNGAVYAFRRQTFERANNIYGNHVLAYIMPPERSVNIDDPDDWAEAEKIIQLQLQEN
jgi:CMP-N-acetylneuraminic acid synthetase